MTIGKKVDRRDFLRLLGVTAGAGVAGSSLSEHDIERPAQPSDQTRPARPWWVHEVDAPTVEVDWERMQRVHADLDNVRSSQLSRFIGENESLHLDEIESTLEHERIEHNEPGYTLKDYALYDAMRSRPAISFLGPRQATTPGDRGVNK